MTLKISRKTAYGREMFQPENETARLFAEFAGLKNLTMDQLRIARKLGFDVKLAQETDLDLD